MQNGMTPLHLAVWFSLHAEDCSTVKILLEHNADCSAEDDVWHSNLFLFPGPILAYLVWAHFLFH